jgi:cytoskeletal protein CcmA (bactofilin family)
MDTLRRTAMAVALVAMLVLPAITPLRAAGGETVPPAPPKPPAAGKAEVPPMPVPPGAKIPKGGPTMAGTPRYLLKAGESHKGDLYLMTESVRIEGDQHGDVHVFGREIEIVDGGKVTGDVNAWVQSADLAGSMGDTVRVFCADLKVHGHIDGDLIAVCGSIVVDKEAEITGDADLKGADIEVHGKVDGDVEATGGQVALSGQVGGNATLKGDVVDVDDDAHVAGDLKYTSRDRINITPGKIVHGEVTYSPEEHKPAVSRRHFLAWFFFMTTALLTGLGVLALFRRTAPAVVSAVRGDALRSAGIGFITLIVVPVAAALSCILIITIPAAILVILAWALLVYLSQVPVAVFLGDFTLTRLGRQGHSPFVSLLLGVPLLYLVFAIPFIGKLALFATCFVGFGAIVISLWAARQARRQTVAGPPPPMAPPPVAVAT